MPKFRHELKYFINYPDYHLLRSRLKTVLAPDEHAGPNGDYTIRSLYFDDYAGSAYTEKYMGVPFRKKYRIRTYNYSDSVIMLECKMKADRYIRKDSVPLSRKETDAILQGDVDFLELKNGELYKVFYHEYKSYLLRPRVVVDYEREAYTMDAGTVRITFDKNVRAAIDAFDIFNPDLSVSEVVDSGKLVLEVKYTEFLPSLVRSLLCLASSEFMAISKYILCCDQTMYRSLVEDTYI